MNFSRSYSMSEIEEKCLVNAVDLSEEYLRLQERLKITLKKGLFSISQAKYCKGNIGQQHFNMDMKATTLVTVTEDDSTDSMYSTFELLTQPRAAPSTHERASNSGTAKQEGSNQDAITSAINLLDTLRVREETAEGSSRNNTGEKRQCDPLKWFGGFVPQPLKEAQASFMEALQLVVDLANCSQALRKTLQDLEIEREACT
ncbi:hypothetical protein CEUSTIGMA_g9002.t1 [Chlamydomonas eustigma]|uniref:Vacuolar ATPase assembly protein VMA22 n=1 Tax=Chlamydomonas eustigma TaxID=1157962 RepID=A0A250XER1_9CHLO|nr:hypothetical protein CEUSTIGMA_g9002.t1 [Chlamydomonas eustigma]|eukprot:GAX81574.1 hypothetical protein CEUSTIGMA_g9002.t1 [Chlamydomonas eustigma]